jgi:hypothetical protein
MLVYSGKDEYVPDHVDQAKQGARVLSAFQPLPRGDAGLLRRLVMIDEANHALVGYEATFVALVMEFVSALVFGNEYTASIPYPGQTIRKKQQFHCIPSNSQQTNNQPTGRYEHKQECLVGGLQDEHRATGCHHLEAG